MVSTTRVLEAIVQLCGDGGQWALLNDYLIALTKRRGQIKQAMVKMVQKAMTFLDATPDKATQLALIDTIRTITAGKVRSSR